MGCFTKQSRHLWKPQSFAATNFQPGQFGQGRWTSCNFSTPASGTLSTFHANSAAQGISCFTTCVLQSGVKIPYLAIKSNIADSLNVIVQIERRPGRRFLLRSLRSKAMHRKTIGTVSAKCIPDSEVVLEADRCGLASNPLYSAIRD